MDAFHFQPFPLYFNCSTSATRAQPLTCPARALALWFLNALARDALPIGAARRALPPNHKSSHPGFCLRLLLLSKWVAQVCDDVSFSIKEVYEMQTSLGGGLLVRMPQPSSR